MAKRAGNLYEQRFFTEALSRGFEVFIPLGDYLPQDAIVMNSAGKLFKVQVKGTEKKDREEVLAAIQFAVLQAEVQESQSTAQRLMFWWHISAMKMCFISSQASYWIPPCGSVYIRTIPIPKRSTRNLKKTGIYSKLPE